MRHSLNAPSSKQWLMLGVVVLLGLFLAGAVASAATLDEIKKRGYLIAATEDDYPPFEFVKDGKPQGLDHGLVTILKQSAPFEIRQEILPWQGLLAGVTTGKYDIAISAALITQERAKSLDFTMPIADGTHYYVKRKGDDRIKDIPDLAGKTVGVQQGSALAAALPELDEMLKKTGGHLGTVKEYASYPEAYQDLANGRLDYVINTIVTVASLVRDKPNVFEMGKPVSKTAYHAWAVKKGNAELLAFFNNFLVTQRKNGSMSALQEQWLGKSFPNLPDQPMLPGDLPIPK
jgi:polar amino acid transport system substrate-binding protein